MREWMVMASVGLVIAWGVWAHNHLFTGKSAPDFSLGTVDGATATLANERGKVVLLDFFATWCPPCRESLPHLQAASQNESWGSRGLVVWAINSSESNEVVSDFLASNRYTFTTLMDSEGIVAWGYGVSGIPMTVIIGRDGRVSETFTGYGGDSGKMIDEAVEKALAESGN
jgi:cytochrome c biogenesis protein CcmG/thiol:disulfide interchange protein DsbE